MAVLKYKITKVCEHCGSDFEAQKSTTAFCSHRCSSLAYKQKKRKTSATSTPSSARYRQRLSNLAEVDQMPYLSVADAATLMRVSRQTIYNMIKSGVLKASRITDRLCFISRTNIEKMIEESYDNIAKPRVNRDIAITEFYTIAQIKAKYKVSESWCFKFIKEQKIPRVQHRGKTQVSKKEIDAHFAKQHDPTITEWYTPQEIQERYGMTLKAIYGFVYDNKIPKRRDGNNSLYSKSHFDRAKAKGSAEPEEFYTTKEATIKFGVTLDALYNQIKRHNIHRIKEGKYVKVSKAELDKLYEEPIILT